MVKEPNKKKKGEEPADQPDAPSNPTPVKATHFAISPQLRTVLLDYLGNKPRKEVNEMCILLEQAKPIKLD